MKIVKTKLQEASATCSEKELSALSAKISGQYDDIVHEFDYVGNKTELGLKMLEFLQKSVENLKPIIKFEEVEVETKVNETPEEIRASYDEAFISEILKVFKTKNYSVHATGVDAAESILKTGLAVNYDSADTSEGYTSVALTNLSDDQILDELFNHMHKHQRQIVVIDENGEDYIPETREDGKQIHRIPKERIVGYIDIDRQKVIYNPRFVDLNHSADRKVDTNSLGKEQTKDTPKSTLSGYVEYLKKLANGRFNTAETVEKFNEQVNMIIRIVLKGLEDVALGKEPAVNINESEWNEFTNIVEKVSPKLLDKIQRVKAEEDKMREKMLARQKALEEEKKGKSDRPKYRLDEYSDVKVEDF